ncbi:Nif3-like dinuclear metal center hexameric protein [Paenibacillus sp. TRM 82003]|nr:Nif3-like dinuclear metal center hexameric protein [Paenibacillus sp. TRM 82003]
MNTLTIQHIVDYLQQDAALPENTVDVLETGSPSAPVSAVAFTFLPTHRVLEEAIALGVNLLISHEGVYYSHRDPLERADSDPVYAKKRRLIEENGLALYRYHDGCHYIKPDLITEGLVRALEWESHIEQRLPYVTIVHLPEPIKTREAAACAKRLLSIPYVRLAGDPDAVCRRIGVSVGYRGGGAATIPLYADHALDLVITGEGPEWEAPEYVRDAADQGNAKALIYLGHAESEEPGMRFIAERLQQRFPEILVHFLADRSVFEIR